MALEPEATTSRDTRGEGHAELWGWFGLSRAAFLVLPRVLMHEMPDEWQARMAALLDEYDRAFPRQPDLRTRVQAVSADGKRTSMPEVFLNYRHPRREEIDQLRASL